MKLAIASGKGGTGKTTVSIALALSAESTVTYLDCDVEEPNGKLFFQPQIELSEKVCVPVPVIDRQRCTGCGDCVDICQFNAIVTQGKYAMVFPELCHSCGGCVYVCPERAITEEMHPVGLLNQGQAGNIRYIEGLLNVGASMATPVIDAVKEQVSDGVTIIDSPPGTSCAMVSTVQDADFVLLVTEPTPFGLHDLKIAVKTLEVLKRPFAVIINRFENIDNCVDWFCADQGIAVLLRIPENRKIAEAYSRGESLFSALPQLKDEFSQLLSAIKLVLESGEVA
ncbi:4Fe-4S dicluster domain-containing protein [Vibrio sp. V27_P1S3P104]|uniref:ATP-binding protein n=1 Tax=Vibrio TaxID=662 RepID=UPI000C165849|nr:MULTISPECIES: ATP-binding protein [Vibrio]NAW69723.1 4Fe-4S dicluster domain-containing protein [Vibrio sp. V28_P6S34P95]NAX06288.1 4Fe-4S dicluster domain-containing protein [Vibrio sp. V30_P3S12P165]NAX34887.1 4Fe-4S dicluster domain-containing protein [Vibrio sp. V29_P1S30P107]NAX37905.1 4Fe-4S dicluster domain-containing protein [Vibrio sp. V27_P1S3P104]NAX41839.1 4Fe-4S dicluster domain-containing protein [Vibrio sp. V26_P1S5P106]